MSENNENVNNDANINTNSWVFLDEIDENFLPEPNISEVRSIQELTEEDLGCTECNSDSDGISVISESEYCTCSAKNNLHDDVDSDKDEFESIKEDLDFYDHEEKVKKNDAEVAEDADLIDSEINPVFSEIKNHEKNINYQLNLNKIALATSVAGMCMLLTYFLSIYNSKTFEFSSDESNTDHDRPNIYMTYEDFIDEDFDKHMWIDEKKINDTCDYSLALTENMKTDKREPFIFEQRQLSKKSINSPTTYENKNTINQDYSTFRKKYISRKSNANKKHKNTYFKQTLKLKENYLNKKDKYLTKKEKYLKKLEKHFIKLEAKLRKIGQRLNKEYDKKYNFETRLLPGDWYHRLYHERSKIRNKEKKSEWLFDRSKMRSILRNKAYWYFNWGIGREEFRINEHLRYGKRKIYESYRF